MYSGVAMTHVIQASRNENGRSWRPVIRPVAGLGDGRIIVLMEVLALLWAGILLVIAKSKEDHVKMALLCAWGLLLLPSIGWLLYGLWQFLFVS
jgi:hypothetical protein